VAGIALRFPPPLLAYKTKCQNDKGSLGVDALVAHAAVFDYGSNSLYLRE
jgi:hypothetical protein